MSKRIVNLVTAMVVFGSFEIASAQQRVIYQCYAVSPSTAKQGRGAGFSLATAQALALTNCGERDCRITNCTRS